MSTLSNDFYDQILKSIEFGDHESAAMRLSEIRNLESPKIENLDLLQRLLSFRIAIRSGLRPSACRDLSVSETMSVPLKGEICFVQGLYFNAIRDFQASRDSFLKAQQFYLACQWNAKALLSAFNGLCGDINLSDQDMSEQHFNRLLELQSEAEKNNSLRVLGSIHRQKSYFFKDQRRWRAAAHEAEMSLKYLETNASRSDFQMALLNKADCALELGDREGALSCLERIVGTMDRRVIFAHDFVLFRLGAQLKPPGVDLEADPHFERRLKALDEETGLYSDLSALSEGTLGYEWSAASRTLKKDQWFQVLSANGKEAKLIEVLLQGSQSKRLIIEKLWPESAESRQCEDRFYQLITRLNRKFQGLVRGQKGIYSINCSRAKEEINV